MPLRPNMEPGDFLEILRRRKWLILFSFLLLLFAAMVYCVVIPDQYESGAKILIIPPSVAEGMVRSTVNISTRDRLRTIEQDILSRTRLLGVINGIGISALGFDGIAEDDMVDRMRRRIELEIERNPDRNPDRNVNTFVLSFFHEKPKVAQDVVSSLSSLFIAENIKIREAVTQETSKFLEIQLNETRVRLEQQEEKIKRYKLQFGGELPQQEQANLNRLQRLQDQIKNNSDSIARLQDRKVLLEAQISTIGRSLQETEDPGSPGISDPSGQDIPDYLLADLAVRRKKLEDLSQKYTLLHPSVVQARTEVAQAEDRIAQWRLAPKKADGGAGTATDPKSTRFALEPRKTSWEKAEFQRLRGQVAATDLEIVALKRENASMAGAMADIQRKVERLPQREQEIVSLTRDYANIKKTYDDLLDKNLKANISMSLEETQKGERFQVVEPPTLPTRPSRPNRVKVLGLALAASLLIGVGGSFGIEILDPTLRGSKEFKSFFELPILASLPVIQDERYKRRIAVQSAAVIGGLVTIIGAYVVFLVIHGEKVRSILQSVVSSIGGKQ